MWWLSFLLYFQFKHFFSYMFVCWVILLHKSLKCKTVDLTNNNLKYQKISQVWKLKQWRKELPISSSVWPWLWRSTTLKGQNSISDVLILSRLCIRGLCFLNLVFKANSHKSRLLKCFKFQITFKIYSISWFQILIESWI